MASNLNIASLVNSTLRSGAEFLSAHYLQQSYFQHMTQNIVGKVLLIDIDNSDLLFITWIANQKVNLRPAQQNDDYDLRVSGSYAQMLNYLANSDTSGLVLEGDLTLFAELNKIQQHLSVDDIIPHPLQRFPLVDSIVSTGFNVLHKTIAQGMQNVSDMTKEYLREESELLAHPYSTESVADQIDQLRLASERLQARINALSEKAAP